MIILASVHWDQFPAQLKAFLDRTYSFMDLRAADEMPTRSSPDLVAAILYRQNESPSRIFICRGILLHHSSIYFV